MANGLFSQKEIDYLKSQRLTRITTAAATLSEEGGSVQPGRVPVGFDFDGNYFLCRRNESSKIYKIQKCTTK
jgi:pyridoxamine 5'-phosphate oxidase family protein